MTTNTDLAAATAQIGEAMTLCDCCPFCGGQDLAPVSCRNDLYRIDGVSHAMRDSDYHVCRSCSLVFSRRRQSPATAAAYYQLFARLEHRDYAVYPPPNDYIAGKVHRAAQLLDYLTGRDVLAPGMTIAHIRCDVGSLLADIGDKYPGCTFHGYDYFDSNVRFANEQGLDGVRLLDPAGVRLPQGTAFDVIICNHLFTHAIDPVADLQNLYGALKPGGVLFLYNEVDHHLRFEPKGPYYQWVALNNFHKQLLAPPSLEKFLKEGGFKFEDRNHRRFYLEYLARKPVESRSGQPDAAFSARAKDAAPVMVENFTRWAALQDSRFHAVVKISGKLKRALLRAS